MTHWSPLYVRQLIERTGWKGDTVVPATAMALTASGGMDHYVSDPTGNVAQRRQGLFALTADEFGSVNGRDVWNVNDNAKAAHDLWANSGGLWGWHPAWWAPQYAGFSDLVEAIANTHGPKPPIVNTDWRGRMDQAAAIANDLFHRMVR